MVAAFALLAFQRPELNLVHLYASKVPTCAEWASEANKVMAVGRQRAEQYLVGEAGKPRTDSWDRNIRSCMMMRLIFDPRDPLKPLRAPMLGALPLPMESMPLADWPDYPMVDVGGVPFLLSENYMLGGLAEVASDYFKYCVKNGRFRSTPYKIANKEEANQALRNLYSSDRWKNIKWKFESPGRTYSYDARFVTDFLKIQLP